MIIYLIGNPLIEGDNATFVLAPILRKKFPNMIIREADSNENFIPEEGSIIIDVVKGIDQVQWFDDIDAFITTKSVTAHDYDMGFHLKLLKKLGKLPSVCIIGIPYGTKRYVREVMELIGKAI